MIYKFESCLRGQIAPFRRFTRSAYKDIMKNKTTAFLTVIQYIVFIYNINILHIVVYIVFY